MVIEEASAYNFSLVLLDKFNQEDEETLDQFQKLTECECHIFRILKKKLEFRNKVTFVDFKKSKKVKKN